MFTGTKMRYQFGDPTEMALYEYALFKGFDKAVIEKEFPRVAGNSF